MTKRVAVFCGVAMVASLLSGCGTGTDEESTGTGLLGTWELSQATVNGQTISAVLYGSADLTLNEDGTFTVTATPNGGDSITRSGTYEVDGNTIAFTVPDVPASAGITMPVTATYEVDADTLEIRFTTPITVSGFSISALLLVR